MNKKAVAWGVVIGGIIGLFIIGFVVSGPLKIAVKFAAESLGISTPSEEGFKPYVPVYTEEETQVIDSMDALACAINSIAAGRFDPDDEMLCPKRTAKKEEKPKEENKPPELSPNAITAKITGFFYKITGLAPAEEKAAKYGNVTVTCTGKSIEQIYLGSKGGKKINMWQESFPDKKFAGDPYPKVQAAELAVNQVMNAVLDCWAAYKSEKDKESYYPCAVLYTQPLLGKNETADAVSYDPIYFDEEVVLSYIKALIKNNDPRKADAEQIISGNIAYGDRLSISGKVSKYMANTCGTNKGETTKNICGRSFRSPAEDKYCVYFDSSRTLVTRDTITIDECRSHVARDTFQCHVNNFELPQKVEKAGWFNPLSWVAGNNDPKYLAYYEAFPEGVDQYWHVDGVSAVTVGLILGTAAFDLIPLAGKGIKYGVKGAISGVKETASTMLQKGIKAGLAEILGLTAKRGAVRAVRKEVLKGGIENIGGGVSKKLAAKVADEADNIFTASFGLKSPKLSAKARQELVDNLAGAIRKMDDITDAIPDTAFAKEFQEEAAKKAGKKIDDLIDAEDVLKRTPEFSTEYELDAFERSIGKTIKQLREDDALLKQIRKEMQEEYANKVSREMAEDCVEKFTTKVTKQQLKLFKERTAVKKFLGSLFGEGAQKFSKEELEKSMGAAMKKFAALPDAQRVKAVEKGMELSKEFIDADGALSFAKIAGNPVDDVMKKQLTGEFLDVIASKEGITAAGMMSKYGWTAAKGLKTGTVGPGYISWTLDLLGAPRAWRVGKTALENAPLNTVPIAGTAAWAGKVGAKTVGEAAGWMKNHKYPIIALLAFYGASRDAVYEKYESVGMNSLGVDSPFLYTDPAPWNLINETRDYFVGIMDSEGEFRNQRMYLVSPCKANLVVSKAEIKCSRMPMGIQHYRFTAENNPMDVKHIEIDRELLADDAFVLENFKKHNPESEWLVMPEAEAVAKVVTDLNNSRRQERLKGASSLYAKHPYLEEMDPDPLEKTITNREQAIAAMERKMVVEFYDRTINGALLLEIDSKGALIGIHKEEQREGTIYKTWQAYEPFFDLSGVQKECFSRDAITEITGTVGYNLKRIFGQDLSIEEIPYVHPNFYVDTITVQVENRLPSDNIANYCIDEYSALVNFRYGFFAAQIVTSLVATGLAAAAATPTGGASLIAVPFVLAGSSVAFGFIEEGIARSYKWPAYQSQGVKGQVPIAQALGEEGGGLADIEPQYTVAG